MNIRDLKYFIAVAEEKHFGKAADKCYVSQPALSTQIQKLEAYLGVLLFERSKKSVHITPAGEGLLPKAVNLVALSEDIISAAKAESDPFSGKLRLGLIKTVGPYISPLILNAIHQELPNISLTLIEGLTPDLETALVEGQIDAAITATIPHSTNIKELPLYEEPFWLALPHDHKLARQKTRIDVTKLNAKELLLLSDGHCLRDQALEICHIASNVANLNTQETSLETLYALVSIGKGLTLAPALTITPALMETSGFLVRQDLSSPLSRSIKLISRKSYPKSLLLQKISNIIQLVATAHIQAHSKWKQITSSK